jgi:hypothetical protein
MPLSIAILIVLKSVLPRIITHIVAEPEAFSTTPRAEANPWHVAAGGPSGILSMIFGKR